MSGGNLITRLLKQCSFCNTSNARIFRREQFTSQLSQADTDELENAADNSEVYNKYSEAEMKFYADTHKVSGEERASQAYDFLQSLEQDDSEFASDYSRE